MQENICVMFGKQWDLRGDRAIEGYPIMQFTGLLDKNGKEIYEGDIVEFLDERFVITFFEQYASFMKADGNDLFNITTQEIVIGNIYENPALLTNNLK